MPPRAGSTRVRDNRNPPGRGSFEPGRGMEAARPFWARLEFHPAPKQARGLNLAELETGILDRRRGRRSGSENRLKTEAGAWEPRRNGAGGRIEGTFTRQEAAQKRARLYVTLLTRVRL